MKASSSSGYSPVMVCVNIEAGSVIGLPPKNFRVGISLPRATPGLVGDDALDVVDAARAAPVAGGGFVGDAAFRLRRGLGHRFENCAHARYLAGFGHFQKPERVKKGNGPGLLAFRAIPR